jgi:hypothetical protein
VIAIRAHTTRALERELRAIRNRGFPTSPQEVNAWYASVPADENSALVILKAYDFYVEAGANDPKDLSEGLVLGETLPPKLAGAIARLVERNGKALAELHRASQLPKSRYPVDLTPGLASLLPHLTQTRGMAELLKWEAIYHSARGNRTNAVRAIESGLGIAASLKDEPIDISVLCVSVAFRWRSVLWNASLPNSSCLNPKSTACLFWHVQQKTTRFSPLNERSSASAA